MNHERYLMGVDGGGSKTMAMLADETGLVLGRGTAGASNFQVIGHQAAQAAIQAAMSAAWTNAGLAPQPLSGFGVGLAGVDRPGERTLFQQWATETHPQAQVVIANDAELVLAAGTPAGWGLALICGTGSIVYGCSPTGQLARADGWGHLLGDEGSGYAIGLAALRAVMRAYDGRGPATALSEAILASWALATATDLVARVYQELQGKQEIAALAATVEAVAGGGDPVAQQILASAGRELALAAQAVAQRLELVDPIPCALAGGVIVTGCLVRQQFESAVARLGLTLWPMTLVPEPALGAIRLAQGAVLADNRHSARSKRPWHPLDIGAPHESVLPACFKREDERGV
jgi:N-acetylglucosamine kinase-like BadF-type ATPase